MHRNQPAQPGHRILVIANETVESPILAEAIRSVVRDLSTTRVLVVAPALNSRLRHWANDDANAQRDAEKRLSGALDCLGRADLKARGWVGDPDPLQAIVDALHCFGAERLVIATQPEQRSNWLAKRLVERARRHLSIPTLHIVVDAANRDEYVIDLAGVRRASREWARAA